MFISDVRGIQTRIQNNKTPTVCCNYCTAVWHLSYFNSCAVIVVNMCKTDVAQCHITLEFLSMSWISISVISPTDFEWMLCPVMKVSSAQSSSSSHLSSTRNIKSCLLIVCLQVLVNTTQGCRDFDSKLEIDDNELSVSIIESKSRIGDSPHTATSGTSTLQRRCWLRCLHQRSYLDLFGKRVYSGGRRTVQRSLSLFWEEMVTKVMSTWI